MCTCVLFPTTRSATSNNLRGLYSKNFLASYKNKMNVPVQCNSSGKLRKFEGVFIVIWLILSIILKIIWGNDTVYATVTERLLDEKIHESINQIFHKQKKRPDIERIYDFMIKVEVLLDIPLEALEEIIKTLKKEGKIVNKNLND